jgi:hypothetical protein
MHTKLLAHVAGLITDLVETHGNSLWTPRRSMSLKDACEAAYDGTDLIARRQRPLRGCCRGDSALAALTR